MTDSSPSRIAYHMKQFGHRVMNRFISNVMCGHDKGCQWQVKGCTGWHPPPLKLWQHDSVINMCYSLSKWLEMERSCYCNCHFSLQCHQYMYLMALSDHGMCLCGRELLFVQNPKSSSCFSMLQSFRNWPRSHVYRAQHQINWSLGASVLSFCMCVTLTSCRSKRVHTLIKCLIV